MKKHINRTNEITEEETTLTRKQLLSLAESLWRNVITNQEQLKEIVRSVNEGTCYIEFVSNILKENAYLYTKPFGTDNTSHDKIRLWKEHIKSIGGRCDLICSRIETKLKADLNFYVQSVTRKSMDAIISCVDGLLRDARCIYLTRAVSIGTMTLRCWNVSNALNNSMISAKTMVRDARIVCSSIQRDMCTDQNTLPTRFHNARIKNFEALEDKIANIVDKEIDNAMVAIVTHEDNVHNIAHFVAEELGVLLASENSFEGERTLTKTLEKTLMIAMSRYMNSSVRESLPKGRITVQWLREIYSEMKDRELTLAHMSINDDSPSTSPLKRSHDIFTVQPAPIRKRRTAVCHCCGDMHDIPGASLSTENNHTMVTRSKSKYVMDFDLE